MKRLYFVLLLCASTMVAMATTSEVLHEGFESGSLPQGWTQEYVTTPITMGADSADFSWGVEKSDSLRFPVGAAAGTARAYARNATTDELRFVTRLVTPVLNLTNGLFQPQLLFSHAEPAKAGSSDTLRVYYRTSSSDIWHPYQTAVYARNASWKTETIGVIAPSTTYQFAFEITENMGYGVMLDEVIVRSTPTCVNVSDLRVTNIHAYDAFLSWNDEGSYNEFQVMLTTEKVTDFTNINPSIIVQQHEHIYNTEKAVSGLTPETTYYAYVRSDCAENASGYTDWVETSFTTLVVIYLPYTQNFNNPERVFENNIYFGLPYGWQVGTSVEDITVPFVYSGGSAADRASFSVDSTAFLSFNGTFTATSAAMNGGEYAYAVSPEIVESSLQGLQISFWLTAFDKISFGSTSYAASLLVGVMEDPADFTSFQVLDTVTVESAYQFKRVSLALDNYTGTSKFVALATRFEDRNAIYVDNFMLSKPSAFIPTDVKVNQLHANGLSVSADKHGADSWNVKVSTAYSRTGDVDAASVLASRNDITAGTCHITVADGSLANQIVYVYTQSKKGTNLSEWSFPVTVRVPGTMSIPYSNTCEVGGGQIQLRSLNQEIRTALTTTASSSVYFPLTSMSQDVKSYPALSSTKPNYQGAHILLEGIDSWFVLPETNELNQLKLVFRYATSAGNQGALEVGVMSDPYDLSTFEHVAMFEADETEAAGDNSILYNRCLVSFDSYTGQGRYIAFRALDAFVPEKGSINLIDQISVDYLGDCREASNVAADVRSSDATITWNGGGMDAWIVGLSTMRSMLNAHYDTVYSPTITFADLSSETTYYYTIQTICGGEALDLDDVSYSFTTPRGLPFTENFNNLSNLTQDWKVYEGVASAIFNGGKLSATSSSYYDANWSLSSSSTYRFAPQSGKVAYVEMGEDMTYSYSYYATETHSWLVSPVLQLSKNIDALELKFDLGIHGYSSSQADVNDKFMVVVSTDGGNTWSRQNATVWSNDGQGDFVLNDLNWEACQTISIDFSQYAGKKIQIAFYVESESDQYENYISIDNVVLKVADPACGDISHFTCASTSTNSAQLRWTLGGVNPYPALVQVSTNEQFTTLLHSDTVQGTTLTINGLEPSSTYYARARQLCPEMPDWVRCEIHTACDARTPEQFGVETFDATGVMNCWTVGFNYDNGKGDLPQRRVDANFGPVMEIAKTATDSTASDGAYAISPEFDIPELMNHYQVVFKAASKSNLETNVHRLTVGVVTDPSDPGYTFMPMATLNLAQATDSMDMKTYVVSFEDYEGDWDEEYGKYVMFLSEAGSDSTNHIYIDDVSLEIAQGCHQVLDLEADKVAAGSAHFTWTGNGSAYDIMVTDRVVNPDTVRTAFLSRDTVTTTSFMVDGLSATTTYYAYIRALCGAEEMSRWSSATRFTTSFGLPFYEGFSASFFTQNPAWKQMSGLMSGDSITLRSTSTRFSAIDMTTSSTVEGMNGYALRANIWSTGNSTWVLTPELDLTTQNEVEIQLSFDIAVTPYSSSDLSKSTDKRFAVGVSTDGGNTFYKKDMTFWACDGSGQYNFKELSGKSKRVTLDLTDYAGQKVVIGFYNESTGSSTDLYYYIDSVAVIPFEAICLGARKLSFSFTDDTTAVATWERKGTPEEMVLVLALDPDFTHVVLQDTVTDLSYTFSHLEYNHTYYLKAYQPGCSVVQTASLTTKRVIPLMEEFNQTTLPSDWSVMKGKVENAFAGTLPQPDQSTQAWKIITTGNGIASNHLGGELYNVGTASEYWLVSPEIKLVAADDMPHICLSFDMALTAHSKADAPATTDNQEFRVLITTDNGQSWEEANSFLFSNVDGAYMPLSEFTNSPTHVTLYLDDLRNQAVRVALYKASSTAALTADNDIHIANFQLRATGEECANPDSLQLVTVSFTSADIEWKGQADKQTVIEYSTLADFSVIESDTLVSGLAYHLHDLAMATTYYVRTYQICGANSVSGYSNTITFKTSLGLPYAEPFANGRNDWTCYKTPLAETISQWPSPSNMNLGWRSSTETSILGANHITAGRQSKGTDYWLVSPMIDLTPNTDVAVIAARFTMALTSGTSKSEAPAASTNFAIQQFLVMISTDDGHTWLPADRWVWSEDASAQFKYSDIPAGMGKEYQLDLTRFGGHQIRVAFVMMGAASGSLAISINNFCIVALNSNCFGVSNAMVTKVDTAAYITLTPADAAHQWQVAYGLAGTELDSMKTVKTDTLQAVLGGLALSSRYEMYARSICAEGDTSAWSGPFAFTTPTGIPYYEYFRNTLDDWSRYTGDPAQVEIDSILTPVKTGWTASASTAILGEEHIYCAKDNSQFNWLVSPSINLMPNTGDKDIYLSFDMAMTSSASMASAPITAVGHTFRVAVSVDDGLSWKEENMIVWGTEGETDYVYTDIPAGKGRDFHLNMTRYAGKAIRIAFIQGAAPTGQSCISINDVELAEYSVPCFGISELKADYANGMATCVILPADSSKTWQYVVVPTGQAPITGTPVTFYKDTFYIQNLPMSSTLDIYARSICSDVDTSAWAGPATIKTPLGVRYAEPMNWTTLDPDWTKYSYSEYSNSFITTTSGWSCGRAGDGFTTPHPYVDLYSTYKYMIASPVIDLGPVASKNIMLSFDLALTDYDYSTQGGAPTSTDNQKFHVMISDDRGSKWEEVALWDDDDVNADFSYSDIPTTGQNYEVDLTGYAGMEVMIGFYAEQTVSGADNYVHIRNVVVDTLTASAICSPIKRATLMDATYTSATFMLRAPGINDALAIEYVCIPRGSLFKESLKQTTDTNIIYIKDLQSSTMYELYARSQCPDSSWTEWSVPFEFSTVECTSVTGLSQVSLTLYDAQITVAAANVEDAVGYQLFITEQGGVLDESQAMTSKTNVFKFPYSFQASQWYDVYARKICLPGDTSAWSDPISIHAPYGAPFVEPMEWTSISDEWSRYSGSLSSLTSTTSGWTTTTSNYGFEGKHVKVNTWYSSTNSYMLVSPTIDLSNVSPDAALTLSFEAAFTHYNSAAAPTNYGNRSFYVLVSTDGTWSRQQGWSWNESGGDYAYSAIPADGTTFDLDMSAYVGQSVQIGFYVETSNGAEDCDLHIRNFVLDLSGSHSSTCAGVDSLKLRDVTLTTAQVSFMYKGEAVGSVAYYELALDKEFTQIAQADTLRNTPILNLQSLAPSTHYYLRIRQICSATDESRWSRTLMFSTLKGVRYREDYEGSDVNSEWTFVRGVLANDILDTRLNPITIGEESSYSYGQSWSVSTAAKAMTSKHIRVNCYGTSCAAWAISPSIDLTPNVGDALLFAFDVSTALFSSYSSSQDAAPAPDDKFAVIVSTDNGQTWSRNDAFIWADSASVRTEGTYASLPYQPARKVLDFSRYAGRTIRIAFYAESTESNGDNYLMVDSLDLNATNMFAYTDTLCEGSEFEGYGFHITTDQMTPGLHELSRISAAMDSVIKVDVMVRPNQVSHFTDTICEGETYVEHGYNLHVTESGTYRRVLSAANGCDSLVYLDLTVLPIQRTRVNLYACRGFSYSLLGKAYFTNAVVRDTLASLVTGCDSVVTYYLYFSDQSSYEEHERVILCPGDTIWADENTYMTEPGYYSYALQSMYGCDSTAYYHLLAADANNTAYDTIYINELPYMYDGVARLKTGTEAGDYALPVVTSCGEIAKLQVTVMEGTGFRDLYYDDKRVPVEKIIYRDHLYIIQDGKWYDPTGIRVRRLEHGGLIDR